MPVRFQGVTEYDRNYRPFHVLKCSSPPTTPAGLPSFFSGLVSEPALQYRKMIDNERKDPMPERDEYILLGDQSKFASSVKYPLKHFRSFYSDKGNEAAPAVHFNTRKDVSPPRRSPPPAPRPADPPAKQHNVKAASYQTGNQGRPKKPYQTVPQRQDKPVAKGPEKHATIQAPSPKQSSGKPAQRPTVNSRQPEKVDDFAQTDLDFQGAEIKDQRPPVDADYAMKYRAKIAPPRPKGPKRLSEYQMQFKWHENVGNSPLLAAEQVVYKSNSVLAGAKDLVPKESEYKIQFKPWKYTPVEKKDSESTKQKMERSKSLNSLEPAGMDRKIPPDNQRLIKESLNPARPFFPHGKFGDYQTEYQKNFKAFSDFEYENGAWRGAPQPQIESVKQSAEPAEKVVPSQRPVSASVPSAPSAHTDRSWYSEVLELRKRASEYRQRARGTHFSREHLAQLYARQADLWDTVSSSSSLSALSLEHAKKSRTKEISKSSPDRPPAGIRTAWDAASSLLNNQNDAREIVSGRTRTVSTDASVSSLSSGSSPSPTSEQQPQQPAAPSTASSSSEGRVPTPKIRVKPKQGTLLRHHLDRTTPAVGGALLTSPPKKKQDSDAGYSPRPVPSMTQSEPVPSTSYARPAQVRCTCGVEGKQRPASRAGLQSQTSPMFVTVKTPPSSPAKASTSSMFQPILRKPVSANQGPLLQEVEERPVVQDKRKPPVSRNSGMLYGLPTRDSHLLVDETASEDQPLETHYTRSPPQAKDTVARRLEYREKHPELSIPSTIMEGGTTEYLNGADDNDDVLSTSARSIASSSSLASEVLERARNRRDEFWGNSTHTRK